MRSSIAYPTALIVIVSVAVAARSAVVTVIVAIAQPAAVIVIIVVVIPASVAPAVVIIVITPVVMTSFVVAPAVLPPIVIAAVVIAAVVIAPAICASSPRFATLGTAVVAVFLPSRDLRVAPRLRPREAALNASVGVTPEVVLDGVHVAIMPPRKRIHMTATVRAGSIEEMIRTVTQQTRHRPLISPIQSDSSIDLSNMPCHITIDVEPMAFGARMSQDVVIRGTPCYEEGKWDKE